MALSKEISNRFDSLLQPRPLFLATYVWLDSDYPDTLRTKTRTVDFEPQTPEDLPVWDCAIAYATSYINTDLFIKPARLFNDPFYSSNPKNKLVLCENFKHDKTVAEENKRYKCTQTFSRLENFSKSKPKFIVEQYFTMYERNGIEKIDQSLLEKGFASSKLPKDFHYCSIGIDRVNGRNVAECHYKACLYAGINIKSFSCEKNLSEWKFEIGPCESYDLADQLLMARFILHRVAEDFDVVIKFDSKSKSKLYFSIAEKDFVLKNLNSIILSLEKVGLKLGNSLLLMNLRINNGLSGILRLVLPENKVELNEILERDLNLKNGQKSNFINELFTSNKSESISSQFSCFFEILISEGLQNFDPYDLLDQTISTILNLLDKNV